MRAPEGDDIVASLLHYAVGQPSEKRRKTKWVLYLNHLAESAREAVRETDGERAIEGINWIFEKLGEAWDGTVAWNAMTCLEFLALRLARASEAGQTSLAMLVQLATNAVGDTRRRLLRMLAEIARGDRQTVEALSAALSGVESPEAFAQIAETLRAIGDAESVAAAFASCARSPAAVEVRAMPLVELAALSPTVSSASAVLDSILKAGLDSQTTSDLVDEVRSGRVRDPRILRLAIGVIRNDRDAPRLRSSLLTLGEVGRGNAEVCAFLREILGNLADATLSFDDAGPLTREFMLAGAAGAVMRVDPGCRDAFDTLVSIIEPGQRDRLAGAGSDPRTDAAGMVRRLRRDAVNLLATSGADQPETVPTLKRLLANEVDPSVRCDLAMALFQFIPREADALHALIGVLPLSLDPYWAIDEVSFRAADTLSTVAPANPEAIAAAVSLITHASTNRERQYGAGILELVGVGSDIARDQLAESFRSATDERLRHRALWALVRVAKGSPEHESALLTALGDDELRGMVPGNFQTVSTSSPRIVEALRLLVATRPEGLDFGLAVSALGSVAGGDADSVTLLTKFLMTGPETYYLKHVQRNLIAIVDVTQMPAVVEALSPYGTRAKSDSDGDLARFESCHAVIWHCCENLPYPIFAEAFHRGTATH